MESNEYEVKVPGKLFIAGEYAVIEPEYDSIVVAIDRYIIANIKENEDGQVILNDNGVEKIPFTIGSNGIDFIGEDEKISFIKASFSVAFDYLKSNGIHMVPFTLEIKSSLNDESTGLKYGLGSSAAIVVATISAILSLHQNKKERMKLRMDKELIFRLSAIAHVKTQGNGSGADIAAAVYGGWIQYRTFDYKWLMTKIYSLKKVTDILDIPWIHLRIKSLTPPRRLRLCVGWTKTTAQTKGMVRSVESFKSKEPSTYQAFLKESKACVDRIVSSFSVERYSGAVEGLKQNRSALKILGEKSGVPILTKEMELLCSIADKYGCGKSSGAGGGDCGIAFITEEDKYKLEVEWTKAGILYLPLRVESNGMVITKLN